VSIWLTRLMDSFTPITQLYLGSTNRKGFRDSFGNPSDEAKFVNNDLGQPYTAKGAGITRELLLSCVRQGYSMPERLGPTQDGQFYDGTVAGGIDVGKHALHVSIWWHPGDRPHLAFAGTVGQFEDLAPLFARFHVSAAVIDLNPETRKVRELQAKMPFLWACQFSPGDRSRGFELRKHDDSRTVTVDRTMACDRLLAEVMLQKLVLPTHAEQIDKGVVFQHLQCPARLEQENKGQRYAVWKERDSGHDDYFMAFLYSMIAGILHPQPRIRDIFGGEAPAPDPWGDTDSFERV
jgi:hypothetical protein